MSWETSFVFALLGVASVLFASGRVRLDIVALLVVLALSLSGVLTVREALAGFGDPVVILVACLLVVGEMLDRTGIALAIGDWMSRKGGGDEIRLLVLLMLAGAGLGAFMSSTAVVAIFIPVALNIAMKSGLNASRLLMPLSYGALISGMLTLIGTTPNLVISAELGNAGFEPLGFFSMTPIGLAVLAVTITYMLVVGRHLLPGGEISRPKSAGHSIRDLITEYGVEGEARQFLVPTGSPLAGRTLGEAGLGTRFDVRVILVERGEGFRTRFNNAPGHHTTIQAGDALLVHAGEEAAERLIGEMGLEEKRVTTKDRTRWAREIGFVGVLIHPESKFIGKTLRDVSFRSAYGVEVIAVNRKGVRVEDFLDTELEFGDSLLVVGPWNRLGLLQASTHDFVVLTLPVERDQIAPAHRRAPVAILILVGMVLLSVFETVPVVIAAMIAALIAVFTRCLTMEDSYRAIHWSSLVLIAGMLPVADALQKTGGVELIVDGLVAGVGDAGPYMMLTVIFFLTASLSLFMSNTATAVLLAPIAIKTADVMQVSPYAFAMAVLIAASAGFMTPVSSPVITLVVDPGKYRFMDFVKVGTPLVLFTGLLTILLSPILFPF